MTAAVSCGVCGNTGFEIVQQQDLPLAGLGSHALAFGICASCGHVQQAPPADPAVMLEHYQNMSNYTAFSDPEALRRAHPGAQTRRLLSIVQDIGAAQGRMYEIGCATGLHLHQFRSAGWIVSGCEPSSKAVEQSAAIYGIEVDCGDEATCLAHQSGLNLILMSHVLEHLFEPRASVSRAHDALAEGGLILVEVPCATAPELLPPGWFSFEHLHYFSPETLTALLTSAGFEIIEMRIALRAFIYPVIAVAARKAAVPAQPICSASSNSAGAVVKTYVAREQAMWDRARARMSAVNQSAYIWGAGVHTAQLLHWTGIGARVDIRGIVDRDPQKWGLQQGDHPVISPDMFFADRGQRPIIVSSYFAEREIAASLRDAGVHPDRIITLYH